MYLLKLIAHQMLGAKWMYYRKIKQGDQGLKLFREASLMEQMKATRSALRFTTKNTKKLYRFAYQECLNEIKKYAGIKEGFPELPESEAGEELPSLTSEFDAVIISWTPLKFLSPAQKIRDKGAATQRHTEGLIAKLYFKVAAYYAIPENWNTRKLTLYLRKINRDSSHQEIVAAFEPLKSDLQTLSEIYIPFKFGKASLSKDIASDVDAFDDAMSVESFESQIQNLYWYDFIYQAIELFLIRYYLTLITSTASLDAIQYITNIFEPALSRAAENHVVFLGSFETDHSKKAFRVPYQEFVQKKQEEPLKKKLKTKEGIFESYTYNLQLLDKLKISFDLTGPPDKTSKWWEFLEQYILAIGRPIITIDEGDPQNDEIEAFNEEMDRIIELPTRQFVFMQLMRSLITYSTNKRQAKYKILERFKQRIKSEYELEVKRVEEMRKMAEKKIREMEKKLGKYKRLKQEETVNTVSKDIEAFKQKLEEKIKIIRQNTKNELNAQKERLNSLFDEVSKEKALNLAISARYLLEAVEKIEPGGEFLSTYPEFIAKDIERSYSKDMEPLYKNLFDILKPTPQEKLLIIQALEKSGGLGSIRLTLDENDKAIMENAIEDLKREIEKATPDVFSNKVIFQTRTIPIGNLLNMSLDGQSLHNLLCLKIASPQSTQMTNLKADTIRAIVNLNKKMNPMPKNRIIQPGKEKDKIYEKRINAAMLDNILNQIQ
ncbi:hypothetical protein KKI24_14650 [bacterium]|nr:hypothetical protein [bacterium]